MAGAYAYPLTIDLTDEVVIAFDQDEDDVGQNGVNGGVHAFIIPGATDISRRTKTRVGAVYGTRGTSVSSRDFCPM